MSSKGYNVEGTLGGQQVRLTVIPPERDWLDASVYAPALPGVLVALIGLLIGHLLSRRRDQRVEVSGLCDQLKELADGAAAVSVEAWLSGPTPERALKIHETKRKIQALGVAATTLRRRSRGFASGLREFFGSAHWGIDVTREVSHLRDAATQDPFEDPDRGEDGTKAVDISVAVANRGMIREAAACQIGPCLKCRLKPG
jgi:hypothetical protein